MLRANGRRLETESRRGLRHRQEAKAAGNSYSPLPVATAPAFDPTGKWLVAGVVEVRKRRSLYPLSLRRCALRGFDEPPRRAKSFSKGFDEPPRRAKSFSKGFDEPSRKALSRFWQEGH